MCGNKQLLHLEVIDTLFLASVLRNLEFNRCTYRSSLIVVTAAFTRSERIMVSPEPQTGE